MINFIIVVILVAAVGSALAYIIKCKKNGKCVGCPDANNCSSCGHAGNSVSPCSGSCTGCGCHTNAK